MSLIQIVTLSFLSISLMSIF